MGSNSKSSSYVEFIYPGDVLGLLSKTQAEIWDFFEKLAWDTYAFEQAKKNFAYPTPNESVFLANPSPHDHFINSYDPSYSYMSPAFCDCCEYSDYDVLALFILILMLLVQVQKRK